jgi:hypothetical protein
MNNVDSQPPPLIYNHEEVRLLLENAKLEGWQEGFEEGHRTGRKTGYEEGKEDGYKEGYEAREKLGQEKEEKAWRKGHIQGYRLGTQDRKGDEHRKWLAEGHGPGLCLSTAAQARGLACSAASPVTAKPQTKPETTTWASASTQTVPRANENSGSKEDNWKHGYGHCVSIEEGHLMLVTEVAKAMASKEAEPTTRNDSSTQTDAVTTTNVNIQTTPAPATVDVST